MSPLPSCECHGEPKLWHRDARNSKGGYWRCRVRKRECEAEWQRKRWDADPIYRLGRGLERRRKRALVARAKRHQRTEG